MKMANAMLFSARLSHLLWPAAVAHANMLRNRLPVRGLAQYTPYELFYGKRLRVDSLRVFGCDAFKLLPRYPKIPGQMARKRLIYVGETGDRMSFRCFDPLTHKFSTEFELIFDEKSSRERINALKSYEARRDLAAKKCSINFCFKPMISHRAKIPLTKRYVIYSQRNLPKLISMIRSALRRTLQKAFRLPTDRPSLQRHLD
jgi:hypothetical protein